MPGRPPGEGDDVPVAVEAARFVRSEGLRQGHDDRDRTSYRIVWRREPSSEPTVSSERGWLGAQAWRRPSASVTSKGTQVGQAARRPDDCRKRPIDLPSRVGDPADVLNESHQAGDAEKSSRDPLAEEFRDALSDHVIYRLAHDTVNLAHAQPMEVAASSWRTCTKRTRGAAFTY